MDYCLAFNLVTSALSVSASVLTMYNNKEQVSAFAAYIGRSRAARAIVRWADRNHLTGRTRDDVFYGTNTHIFHDDTVLKCIEKQHRVPKRPENFFRKICFDIKHSTAPDTIRLDSNLEVRKTFRHMSHTRHKEFLERARSAPANNHYQSCLTRNAASQMLADFKNCHSPHKLTIFSLSGSRIEQDASDGAFRAPFQPSDLSQPIKADVCLHPPSEMSACDKGACVIIATDTLNHVSPKEKHALLGNGICLISYNPTPFINRDTTSDVRNERISFWENGAMRTNVNGGGDYVDELWDYNYDIMTAACPDGDLMMVYIENWRDDSDPTHSFTAEIPFCKIHRRSELYDRMCKYPSIDRLCPLTFEIKVNEADVSYSMFNIKHAKMVQITNNTARETQYFLRSELLDLAKLKPGYNVYKRLDSPVYLNDALLDNHARRQFIEAMGLSNCTKFVKAPEINFATTLTTQDVARRIVAAALAGDKRYISDPMLNNPEVKEIVHDTLGSYFGEFKVVQAIKNLVYPPGFEK